MSVNSCGVLTRASAIHNGFSIQNLFKDIWDLLNIMKTMVDCSLLNFLLFWILLNSCVMRNLYSQVFNGSVYPSNEHISCGLWNLLCFSRKWIINYMKLANWCRIIYFSMKQNFWKTTWHCLDLLPSLPRLFQAKRNFLIQTMSWLAFFLVHGLLLYRIYIPMTPTCPWFLQSVQSKS